MRENRFLIQLRTEGNCRKRGPSEMQSQCASLAEKQKKTNPIQVDGEKQKAKKRIKNAFFNAK
jgi:hypothetical protein